MKLTPVTLAAAVIVIGAAGFLAGRISQRSADAAQAAAGVAETRAIRPSARPGSGGEAGRETERNRAARQGMADRESRKARLEEIVRGENPLDRSRALLA
jgi:hypothetical protein